MVCLTKKQVSGHVCVVCFSRGLDLSVLPFVFGAVRDFLVQAKEEFQKKWDTPAKVGVIFMLICRSSFISFDVSFWFRPLM